jgi:hypothetical protein
VIKYKAEPHEGYAFISQDDKTDFMQMWNLLMASAYRTSPFLHALIILRLIDSLQNKLLHSSCTEPSSHFYYCTLYIILVHT